LKIKLSTVALVVCVAAIIANAVLGVMHFQQKNEQELLASELDLATDALFVYNGNTSILEEQLAVVEARLMDEQQALADAELIAEEMNPLSKLSSGAILDRILWLAKESKIEIAVISTQPGEDEEISGLTYSTLFIDLQASGKLHDLAVFIVQLEKVQLRVVSINEIDIAGGWELYDVILDFSVYYSRN
jgi:hypothetical protein